MPPGSGGVGGQVPSIVGSARQVSRHISEHVIAPTRTGSPQKPQEQPRQLDLCGSNGNSQHIPEGMAATSFQGACRKHDRCYGTLGNTQEQCDQQLGQDILDECKIRGGWLYALSAYVYYRALAGIPGNHKSGQSCL